MLVCEFWKTLSILKFDTTYEYIKEKKEIKIQINKPSTIIFLDIFIEESLILKNVRNWNRANPKDSQRAKLPNKGTISCQ